MRTLRRAALIAALPVALASLPYPALAVKTSVFEGNVVHISTDNIKVKNQTQTLSFLLVPKFDRVFSSDGKTTYQMKDVRPGQLVKVYYDQKALGARHADRILVLTRREKAAKQVKS
jgi:hypothetical protein